MSKLRVAVLAASIDQLRNWELKLLNDILMDNQLDLCAVVLTGPFTAPAAPLFSRLLYNLDKRVFARQPAYPAKHVLSRLRTRPLVNLRNGDDLSSLNLDVVVRLAAEPLSNELLKSVRFGEWTFNFTETQSPTFDWTGFWEVKEKAALTITAVNIRQASESVSKTLATAAYNTKFSAALNGAFVEEKSVILMMRELRRLADTRELKPQRHEPLKAKTTLPGMFDATAYMFRLAGNVLGKIMIQARSRLGLDARSWRVHIGNGSVENFVPGQTTELKLAEGMWAADPFLFRWNNEDYIFFECFPNNRQNAWISVAKLADNKVELLGTCLRTSYHLSYPFIFNDGGDIFMIPETHQTNRVEVWRCTQFPLRWELYATTLEGQSPADTIMFRTDGQWWLLTSLSDHYAYMDHCSELYAFAVDGPALRSVVPHKRNPVIIGSDVARNAGRVHIVGDRLLRPSQCNSNGTYGYGLNIQEITKIDSNEYAESAVRLVRPDFMSGIVGCHHIDILGDRFVIDLCKAR